MLLEIPPTSLALGETPISLHTAAEIVCIMEMVVFAVTATLPFLQTIINVLHPS